MNNHFLRLLTVLVVFLSACTSALPTFTPVPPTSTQSPTAIPTRTSEIVSTATSTSFPTLSPSPLPSATLIPTQTPTPIVVGPQNFPADTNPLTGLPPINVRLLDRRPILIKVSNFPREGRPQAGLSFADIVFEHYIGEGTNRFTALYYGQDADRVGPIRSARLVDSQLTRLYQGIFAFAAADPNAVLPVLDKQLGKRAISFGPSTCPALCDIGPHSVFSVFADTAKLSVYAAEKLSISQTRPNLEGMSFTSLAPLSTLQAQQISVIFNAWDIGIWRYNQLTGLYQRWIEAVDASNTLNIVPLTDRLTGEQLGFANVVLLFAPYTEYAPTLHDITLWYNQNGRRAVLFRDGLAYESVWKSPSTDRPIQFLTPENQPLRFKPGNTWIVIVGVNSKLKTSVQSQWELNFALP